MFAFFVQALKSAERKTVEMLKEVQVTATLNKARKNYWLGNLTCVAVYTQLCTF